MHIVTCLVLTLFIITKTPLFGLGFANGIKIGEVTDTSAVVWTRLTLDTEAKNPADSWTSQNPNWLVPGIEGQLRVILRKGEDASEVFAQPWTMVSKDNDCCYQTQISGLTPSTSYQLEVQARPDAASQQVTHITGSFNSAPSKISNSPVRFTISTCQEFELRDDLKMGHQIYQSMLRLKPDFFIQTGDTVYYDRKQPLATNIHIARYRWNRMYALPYQREFHRFTPSYWMHDDHDLLRNDCWPGQSYGDLTWAQGLQVWHEQIPQSDLPYRTFYWGKNLQIWLPEGREYRSPNNLKDGPEKSILGKQQWKWLEQSMKSSKATFKLYISSTPVVGPDRALKNDNHANEGFSYEGKRLRQFLQNIPGCFVINGDRHWQYHSIDPLTGLNEFGCGPASDAHAEGYSLKNREHSHQFLRVKGGFVSIFIQPAKAIVSHHDVLGNPVYQTEILVSQSQ